MQGMFEPYLKSFYIRSTDPTQIKILKVSWKHPAEPVRGGFGASWSLFLGSAVLMLWGQENSKAPVHCHHAPMLPISSSFPQLEVLTNLANETNISTILREFQVCHGHTEAPTLAWLLVPNQHRGGGRGEPLQEEWAEAMPTPSAVPEGPNV